MHRKVWRCDHYEKAAILILALIFTFSNTFAFADSAADTIINAGTAQAFTDEPVSEEDLLVILQAGLAAESAINQQPWYFAAITSSDVMADIPASGTGFGPMPGGAPAGAPAPEGMPGGGDMPFGPGGGAGAKASLGDSPAAIIIYMDRNTSSPNAGFDCGLAAQNMYIAAVSLGYGVKIVSSPTMTLNGDRHDEICEKLGVDTSLEAIAVLLIGRTDETVDAVSSASTRMSIDEKVSIIK